MDPGLPGYTPTRQMSDTRAAIRELRSLSEKRSTQGLTEQERSRLAELRERLGLPAEPAEARSGGPPPGGPPAPGPVPPSAPSLAAAVSMPPTAPAALPTFESSPPEAAPKLPDLPPRVAAAAGSPVTSPVVAPPEDEEPLPDARTTDPELDLAALTASRSPDAALTLPDLGGGTEAVWDGARADALELTGDAAAPEAEAWAEAADLPPAPEATPDAALPADPAWAVSAGEAFDGAGEAPAAEDAPPADALPLEPAWTTNGTDAFQHADAAWGSNGVSSPAPLQLVDALPQEPAEQEPPPEPVAETEPPAARPALSLAQRIDAAESSSEDDTGRAPAADAPWEAPEAPLELGATPLDDADPGSEPGFVDPDALIELSSADVESLDEELGTEPDLSGQASDPLPLAGSLAEMLPEQPPDPRALAFDDQGEEPTFVPEDLQSTEAELTAEAGTYQPADLQPPPAVPTPPPAAPRISVPRPPAGPPPPRPAATAPPQPPAPPAATQPTVPAPPRSPMPVSAVTAPQVRGPPPPPPAAYALGDDGRRVQVPALSVARPEPPQLSVGFGRSGPFAQGKPVLLTPAPLDTMDALEDAEASSREPEAPPATDVATGAEVFGGAYLNPTFVEGEHRVVLHTLEGQVKRGMVKDLDLMDPVIRLAQPGRPPEAIAAERVKAIFFMQEPGTTPFPAAGRRIRVGFADGRQIVGFSEDVDAGEQGFFLVPADTRTHTARIYVFRAGVHSITPA